jgi:hypothetical protein
MRIIIPKDVGQCEFTSSPRVLGGRFKRGRTSSDFLTNQPFYFELCTCNNEALSKKQVCTSGGIVLFVTISPVLFSGHVYEAQARHPKRILGLAAGHASSCATCEYGLSMFTHSDLSRNHLPVGPMTRFHS